LSDRQQGALKFEAMMYVSQEEGAMGREKHRGTCSIKYAGI
jgi:hypothetical protein